MAVHAASCSTPWVSAVVAAQWRAAMCARVWHRVPAPWGGNNVPPSPLQLLLPTHPPPPLSPPTLTILALVAPKAAKRADSSLAGKLLGRPPT